jgi:hypothetical protein
VTPCGLEISYLRFGGKYRLHLHVLPTSISHLEAQNPDILRNKLNNTAKTVFNIWRRINVLAVIVSHLRVVQ